ncbi:MAG TPA: glycosyltransferase, partial [Alphaproteobacteria bacterium]|nr:glycosyltransferase [Alphaproteobacteria bacterium]
MQQTVVTTHIPGSERAYPLFERSRLQAVGPSLPPFLATHLLGFTWFWALVPYLLRHLRGFDLVHLHLDHSIWCRILALALKLGPVPVVISLNVSLLSDGAAEARPAPTGLRLRLERWALCLADRVVALSPHQAKMMNLLAPKHGDRVWIVPDAIDPAAFRAGIDDETVRRFRLQHKIPENGPVAAYIGRISEEKGWRDLPAIVQALSRKGVFVLICGDGPCRGRLERELRARCADSAWCVTGFVPRSDVKAALRIADVIVLPSRREAFGSILLEAMAWEVPAIAYRVGGIPDVAGEPNAFALVPPQAPDRLAERALALIADRALHRSLVERGTQRVKEFSTVAARDRLLQLYDGVEGPGPQRREAPAWP